MTMMARAASVTLLALAMAGPAEAQQFTSDNYVTMPHGTLTAIVTLGSEYGGLMTTVGLFPRWEFTAGAFLTWDDPNDQSSASYSTTFYAKYMAYENAAQNGGFAIAAGTGTFPGYYENGRITDPFRTFWAIPQLSLPFFSGRLLWDLNPGVSLNTDAGGDGETSWAFTYATRAALYGLVPESAIVGEIFGTEDDSDAPMQYRVGVRWEPSYSFVLAATWSQAFDGSTGGGFEIGMMLFSPPFTCLRGCPASSDR